MFTFDLVVVFFVLLFILVSIYRNLIGISFTFLIAVIVLGVFGILTPSEIVNGFGNEQVAVVILMLLFSDVLRKTNIIENSFDRLFRTAKNYRGFISRMVLSVAGFSMILNNTPLVAVMMPYIHSWSKRNNFSPSKFLIPLSYGAILGGSATLIGTSTNLIVNSMVEEQTIFPGMDSLGMFDFIWVGLPMIIIGWLYLFLFGNLLLPSKKPAGEDDIRMHSREYMIEAKVRTNSHLIGKTVSEAGLSDIQGLILVEILRRSFRITSVLDDVVLDKGDTLVFAGETKNIAELITTNSGLVLPEVGMLSKVRQAIVNEVVISQNSKLINKNGKGHKLQGKI